MTQHVIDRRQFLKQAAAGTAITLAAGRVRGANDRVRLGCTGNFPAAT